MEIDVTRFIKNYAMWDYAHSAAEGGSTAGEDTWRNAMEDSDKVKFVTKKNVADFRDYFGEFGAWDEEELRGMSNKELNALFLQFVASAHRELEAGGEPGALYQGDSGRWYYYVGM